MKPKTDKEIKSEVLKLQKLRPHIPPRNFFGDDNRSKIDAEIVTLAEKLSEDQVIERFAPDETAAEFQESDHEIKNSALYAFYWMNGQEKEAPSDGWLPLIPKSQR